MRYTAQIRLKRAGKVIHSESETFTRQALAAEWMRRREAELDKLRAKGVLEGARYTLLEVLQWYRKEVGGQARWGISKESDLRRLEGKDGEGHSRPGRPESRYPILARPAYALTAADYIEHVEARRAEGAGPATAGNDLVWLGQALRSARPTLGVPADLQALADARHELRQRKLIAKPRYRDRRITTTEHALLTERFRKQDGRSQIQMLDVMDFAIASARRQEEITRLKWVDLDREKGIGWLDDLKHPTQKVGNRRSFRMTAEAWAVIDRQDQVGEFVFPYNPGSIGSRWEKACKLLGIKNLRFHDLRHEATSRLFERGYSIQEVAQFTLHDSWATLKRYTHLKPEDVVER